MTNVDWDCDEGAEDAGAKFSGITTCSIPKNGYTFSMKTAISIPDDLYNAAEALARDSNKSRSRLFSDALREYLARHEPDSVTEAMNRVCEVALPEDYAFAKAGARRVLKRSEW